MGGGKPKETVLWTNSSPTSNFAAETVTLSQSIVGFDYIQITYARLTSAQTTDEDIGILIIPTSKFLISSGNSRARAAMSSVYNNTNNYRIMRYDTDTTVAFSGCHTSSGSGINNACIPLKISGLK